MMFRSFVLLFLIPIGAQRLPCLLVEYFVSLSCKISANIKALSLIDNNGNDAARCTLQGSSSNCFFKDFVKPVIGDKVVIFHLHRNLTTNVDTNWFCSQENITFRPEILSSKADKTASTIVNLVGKIVQENNTQKILLTCSSCRIPNENHAEFLINYNSVDSLTYDDATGKCTHSYGECSRRECNCSTSGNEFSRFFVSKKELNTETYFSCDMRFHMKDEEQLIVFSKVSTLSFNGTDFTDRGTRTVLIKLTDINNRPKEEDRNTENILIPVIIASVIMVTILLTVAVYCNRKGRRLETIKKLASEEDTPLLKDLEKHDQYVQVNIDANNAETHDQYVQVNFDADNILLNVISPESNSTRGHILKKTYPESKGEMDDEDYVKAPDKITSKSISDRIERGSKHNNEKNEEKDDEDYVQASEDLTLESIPDHIKTELKLRYFKQKDITSTNDKFSELDDETRRSEFSLRINYNF